MPEAYNQSYCRNKIGTEGEGVLFNAIRHGLVTVNVQGSPSELESISAG